MFHAQHKLNRNLIFTIQLAGAKKGGLGATKVKTNFADIEQRANLSDQHKELVCWIVFINRK